MTYLVNGIRYDAHPIKAPEGLEKTYRVTRQESPKRIGYCLKVKNAQNGTRFVAYTGELNAIFAHRHTLKEAVRDLAEAHERKGGSQ